MDVYSSDDEYEDYASKADFVASRHAMVFCIDASEEMFEPVPSDDEPKKCYLQVCLERVKERIVHTIFVSDKEYISIFLMGIDLKANTTASSRSVELFELSRPGAEICTTLDTLTKKTVEEFKSDFYDEYNVHPNSSLSDTLWTCSSQLSLSQTKFSVKDVVIMTRNNLSDLDANTRRQTLKRAEALAQVGIFLRLMYFGDKSFIEPFYKDLLLLAHPGSSVISGSHWAATDLVRDPSSILSKSYHNRHNARVDFVIGSTTKISVKVYSFFRRLDHVSDRQEVKLYKQTNEQLTVTSSRFDATTGELLHRDKLMYGIKLDNTAAYFKKTERSKAKEIYPVNITLLGFKPVSEVFWGDHIKPGMMLVPDEVERPGSSSLFYALHKVCLEDGKSPLVRICMRKGSRARLAHLLPMLENIASNVPINYFLLKYMPFQGECRDLDVALQILDKEDLSEVVEGAKNIIKKSTCKFIQAAFPNPKLNMFYSAVEALALNLEQPREVVDNLEPEVDEIDHRVGQVVKEFNACCESAAATLDLV